MHEVLTPSAKPPIVETTVRQGVFGKDEGENRRVGEQRRQLSRTLYSMTWYAITFVRSLHPPCC